jgi:Mn-dependent DtxR family transcriptional regulator
MKFKIELEIIAEEIEFLKKFFDFGNKPNTIFWKMSKEKEYFKELESKGIIKIDSINNCHLTAIGEEILKQVSRENIIDKLI